MSENTKLVVRMDQMQKKLKSGKEKKNTMTRTEGQPLILCHLDVKGEWHDFREER